MSRRAIPVVAVVSVWAFALTVGSAAAAPGDFEIVYDWTDPQTGFAGVAAPLFVPELGTAGFQTPYYQASVGQPGAGLVFAPAVSSGGVADRSFPFVDPVSPLFGPLVRVQINRPGQALIRQARFDRIDYRRAASEQQFLRMAIGDAAGNRVDYDTTSTAGPPGPWMSDTDYSDVGTVDVADPEQDGVSVQAWMHTSCDPACPTVSFDQGQPRSHGRVGRVRIDLYDPASPQITLAGSLTDGAWTNARGTRTVTITATDADSGITRLRLERRRGSGPWRTLIDQLASCDVHHAGPGEPGREAAPCPSSLPVSFTQAMGKLRDGIYTYRATATDDAERQATDSFTVRVDRHAPNVKLAGPLRGLARGWLRRTDTVDARLTGSDRQSGVAWLDLFVRENGRTRLLASLPACSPQCPNKAVRSSGVDFAALVDGQLEFFAVARDAAGNRSRQDKARQLRADRTAPYRPRGLQGRVRNGKAILTWKASKDPGGSRASGLKRYQVRITDRSTFRALVRPRTDVHTTRLRIPAPPPRVLKQERDPRVTIQAVDTAGNTSTLVVAKLHLSNRASKPRRKPKKAWGGPGKRTIQFGFTDGPWGATPPPDRAGRLAIVHRLRDAIAAYVRSKRNHGRIRQQFVSLRFIGPYDMWSLPATATPRKEWAQFTQMIADYNTGRGTLPPVRPYVTIMSHDFTICDGKQARPEPHEAGFNDLGPCKYPSIDAYKQYLRDWYTNAIWTDHEGVKKNVQAWGAWNEPNNQMFTLYHLGRSEVGVRPEIGARRAADYWIAAREAFDADDGTGQPLCGGCTVVAGEFSGYSKAWATEYLKRVAGPQRDGEPNPHVWSLHPYSDLNQGKDRTHKTAEFVALLAGRRKTDELGKLRVWVTEIGALLRTDPETTKPLAGEPQLQFRAGQDLMRLGELSKHIERIYYYGAMGSGAPFDSHIFDHNGKPRPVLCGILGAESLDSNVCGGDDVPYKP